MMNSKVSITFRGQEDFVFLNSNGADKTTISAFLLGELIFPWCYIGHGFGNSKYNVFGSEGIEFLSAFLWRWQKISRSWKNIAALQHIQKKELSKLLHFQRLQKNTDQQCVLYIYIYVYIYIYIYTHSNHKHYLRVHDLRTLKQSEPYGIMFFWYLYKPMQITGYYTVGTSAKISYQCGAVKGTSQRQEFCE